MALTFVQRVKEFLTGKKDIRTGTRLIINCEKLENRVALMENGLVEEYTIERTGTSTLVGSIFKGKVRNIEHGLKAMFIDIGLEKMPSCISGMRFPKPFRIRAWRRSTVAAR